MTNRLCHPAVSLKYSGEGTQGTDCGLAQVWLGHVGTPATHVFQDLLQAGHAQDGDPDGHHGAQEVAILQGVIVHDAHHGHTWLVTRVVELQPGTKAKVSINQAASHGSLGGGGRRRLSPEAGSLLKWLQESPPNHCDLTESRAGTLDFPRSSEGAGYSTGASPEEGWS